MCESELGRPFLKKEEYGMPDLIQAVRLPQALREQSTRARRNGIHCLEMEMRSADRVVQIACTPRFPQIQPSRQRLAGAIDWR